jgi:hypothetical protein
MCCISCNQFFRTSRWLRDIEGVAMKKDFSQEFIERRPRRRE